MRFLTVPESAARGSGRFKLAAFGALLAGCLALVVPSPSTASASVAQNSPKSHIQVWQANLEMLSGNWKGFIDRMFAYTYKPDIITLQEVVKTDANLNGVVDIREVINYLNTRSATTYNWFHGDANGDGRDVSAFAVIYNDDRFDVQDTTNHVKRWREICNGVLGKTQIAIRLWDTLQTRSVVATSIHWNKSGAESCAPENLRRMNQNLENWFGVRRLTIVGGDFNTRVDKSTDTGADGNETNPLCWYRWMSATDPNDPCGAFDASLDTYYETVRVDRTASVGSPAMCEEWTHPNDGTAGDACTPATAPPVKKRIDYIWVRWEDGYGDPRPFTVAQAQDAIVSAGVDGTARWSDHRPVQALVRWCLTTENC